MEIVEPARNTGSSTAYGVFAPVRPTFTSMRMSFVCACWAGNLKATAQRGNFAVVPSRVLSARSSTLMTTPSVSNCSSCRPSAHERQKSTTASIPAQAVKCRSTGRPHSRIAVSVA
jgi:hypothetical protein